MNTKPYVIAAIADNQHRAKPARCRRCNRTTLVGLDDDRCAMTARVNPTSINPTNEPLLVAAGLHTYNLVRGQLFARYPENRSVNSRVPIHAEHKCERGKQ